MTDKMIICERCGEYKLHKAKGLCKTCYENIRRYGIPNSKRINAVHRRQYYKEHPELVSLNHLRTTTCKILDDHHNDLIDDDQSFSTQYILDMCKGVKSNYGVIHR